MKISRRNFIAIGAGAGALWTFPARSASARKAGATDKILEQAAARPVLDLKGLNSPVIIESVELLRKGKEHFVRVRSKDGAEGISVDNGRMDILHPILNR